MYILTYMLALTQETLPVFATIVAVPMGTHCPMLLYYVQLITLPVIIKYNQHSFVSDDTAPKVGLLFLIAYILCSASHLSYL